MALSALILIISFVGMFVLRQMLRRQVRRTLGLETGPPTCVCGYPLAKLEVPRCPECGRIVGFDATAEDLGLSYEQLQRVKAAREQRARAQKS